MKKLLLLLLPLMLTMPASASPMRLDAAFSSTAVDLNGSSNSLNLAGSFVWFFDSNIVPASGSYNLGDQTLSSLNLAPSDIGTTTYDTTNTYLSVSFFDGILVGLNLDDRGHDGVGTGRDDFLVYMYGYGAFEGGGMFYSLASEPNVLGYDSNQLKGSFSVSSASVPEATRTAWLIGSAFLGLALLKRTRRITSRAEPRTSG
jgi:hypothetical protein